MKLLYLNLDRGIPVLGAKGAALHIRAMVGALARAGHDVTLAAPRLVRPGDEAAEVPARLLHIPPGAHVRQAVAGVHAIDEFLGEETGAANEVRRLLYNGDALAALTERLADDPPDAVYERLSLLGSAGSELARRIGIPHLVEINAPLSLEADTYRRLHLSAVARAIEGAVLARASDVFAVSSAVREHVVALGVSPERAHVLPNAINPDEFHPMPRDDALRAELGAGPDDVLAGFIGGLRPWHGVEALPELLARLHAGHRRIRMVVVGDGPLRATLAAEFAARGVDGVVRLTGAIPHGQVPALAAQLDIALAPYPALDHAFYFSPLKLFEYMGAGAAVVVPRIGQIAEIVEDGRTGLLYPPGDIDALTDRCARLVDDPGLRAALGAAGAALVHDRYTWDRNAARVVELAATGAQAEHR